MFTLRFVLPQGERLRTRQVRVSVVLVPLSLVGYSMLSVLVFILVLVLVVFILVFVLVFVEVLVYVFLRLSVTLGERVGFQAVGQRLIAFPLPGMCHLLG